MIVLVLPDIPGEKSLLRRAEQADSAAQREIYEAYFPPIYQFIRLRVDDREQARDIASDVFLDFFVALNRKRTPERSLRGWLFRVARNKLYDYYGQRERFTTTTLDDWEPVAPDDGPETAFINKANLQRARQMLGMLVPEQQEVLILRFGQALSLQATADIMGKSISAVKSLQFRAVTRLRQMIDEDEGIPTDG